jgi:hypothetical protein
VLAKRESIFVDYILLGSINFNTNMIDTLLSANYLLMSYVHSLQATGAKQWQRVHDARGALAVQALNLGAKKCWEWVCDVQQGSQTTLTAQLWCHCGIRT